MFKRLIAYGLCCLFLSGSTLLPLCDFSLAADLPAMYQSYKKLAAPDEVGLADFIGDYLFAGKALLGHNKTDRAESQGTSVQFQHSPISISLLYTSFTLPGIAVNQLKIKHLPSATSTTTTGFHPELFRPPLA